LVFFDVLLFVVTCSQVFDVSHSDNLSHRLDIFLLLVIGHHLVVLIADEISVTLPF